MTARPPAAAAALDPVVTLGAVQRYVDAERARGRRVMVWTGSVFLLLFLLLLVGFIGVGILVLRSSGRTAASVTRIEDQTALYAMEVVAVSNRLAQIESAQDVISAGVRESEQRRYRNEEAMKAEVERIGQQVFARVESQAVDAASLGARLAEIERVASGSRAELEQMRRRYEELQASVISAAAAAAASPAAPAPAPPPEAPPAPAAALEGPDDPEALSAETLDRIRAESKAIALEEVPEAREAPGAREISVVTFPNGDRYEGEFRDGLMHGWGIYATAGGDRYEGEFKDDMKDGRGVMTWHNGDRYTGEFRADMREGRGSMLFHNGDRYTGEFRADAISGTGTFVATNGNRYAGQFRNGLKHGNGILSYANGDVYKGEFRDDVREGKGAYIYSDGSKYVGEFKSGRRHGTGRFLYVSGEQYTGEFKDGRRSGAGTMVYPDGQTVRGVWKDDRFVRAEEDAG